MANERGALIVLSGPSGTGKSTVIRALLQRRDDIRFSISATTRRPREGERHGIEYYFLTHEQFAGMLDRGELLEHAEYVGNLYGTPAKPVEDNLAAGCNVLLDIEIDGACQVMACRPDAVTVFLIPPSFAELERRLRSRATDDERVIRSRLERAREECAHAHAYKFIVVNDVAEKAAAELDAIITAELCRRERRIHFISDIVEGDKTL